MKYNEKVLKAWKKVKAKYEEFLETGNTKLLEDYGGPCSLCIAVGRETGQWGEWRCRDCPLGPERHACSDEDGLMNTYYDFLKAIDNEIDEIASAATISAAWARYEAICKKAYKNGVV